jgi:Mg2+-importing ATPase
MKKNLNFETNLREVACCRTEQVYSLLKTAPGGLTQTAVEAARDTWGRNTVTARRKASTLRTLFAAFANPFTAILLVLALISAWTDILAAAPGEKDPTTVLIITTMVTISGVLRFVQERRSGNAAEKLSAMIRTTACVQRSGMEKQEIPMEELVVGDLVFLAAGDMIPADLRIVAAKDLFLSQSALTGESEPVEKFDTSWDGVGALTTAPNLVFSGSSVVSGSAMGIVAAVGDATLLGSMAGVLSEKPPKTAFEKGVNAVSWVLIRFMLLMVPVVLFLNGFTKGNWAEALLFAVSVAVGLTPEMLPMIVTTCLAKGAVNMSREKVIVKNLNAIQNLGSMDVLCTDKTGTLTQDQVVLERHLDLCGREDDRVLRHAFLNSYFQTGLKNLMDRAILARTEELSAENQMLTDLASAYCKVDEIPFDFSRRRMSVVVADKAGKTQMITKGAIEEMLAVCRYVEYDGTVTALTERMKETVLRQAEVLNRDGMRVLGVAQKTNPTPAGTFSVQDESDMVLIGYLAFLDPPKSTAAAAMQALKEAGVSVKILTGDNERVTRCVCRQVGLRAERVLLGEELEGLTDHELAVRAEKTTIFAKLSPTQKARVVRVLREAGHSVGFLGDGINDAAAMRQSDVGLSVDTAVDIAKESADVILMEKDLMVLARGILEGRRTYGNLIKYIKMTASSNFGNMFSVLAASVFLPFLPMAAIQLILLNLIYDLSCTAIPWDKVDEAFLKVPRRWAADSVGTFMLWLGPTSSVFDILTYLLLYFVICPAVCGGGFHQLDAAMQQHFIALFQAGWFVESMWTQTLVIHMIRTPKLPFVQSRAAWPVTGLTFGGIVFLTCIPFTKIGTAIGLTALPGVYFVWLPVLVGLYMLLATVVKKAYIRRYGELL